MNYSLVAFFAIPYFSEISTICRNVLLAKTNFFVRPQVSTRRLKVPIPIPFSGLVLGMLLESVFEFSTFSHWVVIYAFRDYALRGAALKEIGDIPNGKTNCVVYFAIRRSGLFFAFIRLIRNVFRAFWI